MKKRVFLLLLAWFMVPGVAISNPQEDQQRAERIVISIQDCADQSDANKIWKKLFEKTKNEEYNTELIIRANRAAEQLKTIKLFWADMPEDLSVLDSENNLYYKELCKDVPPEGTLFVYNCGNVAYLHSGGNCFDMITYVAGDLKKSGRFDRRFKRYQKIGKSWVCVLKQTK